MFRVSLYVRVKYIAPLEEHYHNLRYTTFQERGKTTGQGNAIASKEQ
jgi:hypothetical protein